MNGINIFHTDCLSGLIKTTDSSIDMVITSPPYEDLREYNEYEFDFEYFQKVVKELFRVLKLGGVIVWVVADEMIKNSESGQSFKQALYFKEIGFNIWDTMIFAKMNPPPKNHKRYEQEFEYMFVFTKGIPKTFNPILIPCKYGGQKRSGSYRHKKDGQLQKLNTDGYVKDKKIKGNIWSYTVGKHCTKISSAHKHPAIFPDKLVEDHLATWTVEKDIVLDPFMGSGTVARICYKMNRQFIGFEISEEYCQIAEQSLTFM